MKRAFQTLLGLTNPEVVFILGDIFDEGQWASQVELKATLLRFRSIFAVPENVKMYSVVGNHDIGFHYAFNEERIGWFEAAFEQKLVKLLTLGGDGDIHFVLLNSMAMERDGCRLCYQAEKELRSLNATLNCWKNSTRCEKERKNDSLRRKYSRPIILQHFPLFRPSDAHCSEADEAPIEEKSNPFRPNWECLNEDSTKFLLKNLKPRLVFSGHTHHGCLTLHEFEGFSIPEYTLSSFSWRNKVNPAVFLAIFSRDDYWISKCFLPVETTIFAIYALYGAIVFFFLLYFLCCFLCVVRFSDSRKNS